MTNGQGKSDSPVVPEKPPNEAAARAEEVVEGGSWSRGTRRSLTSPGHRAGSACTTRSLGYVRQQRRIGSGAGGRAGNVGNLWRESCDKTSWTRSSPQS